VKLDGGSEPTFESENDTKEARMPMRSGWARSLSPFSTLPAFNTPGLARLHPAPGQIEWDKCQTPDAEDP